VIAQRAVRGTLYVLAGSYTNMGMGLVYGVIMARLLEPEHFGIFALAMFFVTFLDVRSKLGLDYAFVHRQATTSELLGTHWTLQTLAALSTLVLVAVASMVISQLNYPIAIPIVATVLASALIVEAVGTTARAQLEKELVFSSTTVVTTTSFFFSYVTAIALALRGFTYWALVAQVACNTLLNTLGFWWAYRRQASHAAFRFRFDSAMARWMLRFGAVLALGAIATAILLQFDNFLVGTLVGAAALGFYAQAYKVAQWPTGLVTHIVSRAALPTYAKLQNDPTRLAKAFEMTLWVILTLATPLALAIFASAPDFLRLIYGDKWLPSAILLRFLVGYSVLRPLLDDTGALFSAIGQPRRITTVLVAQALTLVICATPLTLWFSAVGTALGVGIAFVIGIALTYRFVAKTLVIDLVHLFYHPSLAAVGSVAIYFLLTRVFDFNMLPLLIRVILKGGIVAGLFIAISLVLQQRALFVRLGYIWRLMRSSPA
jgi:O-antigen/teichoic acid export membrane protein